MKASKGKQELSAQERDALLGSLKTRFEANMHRHKGSAWKQVLAKLDKSPDKVRSLHLMEESGGEPDVVSLGKKSGELLFVDCSAESPKGRRSVCYDREGLNSRKEHKPKNSALDLCDEMGVELLTEDQYRALQQLEDFDLKTSSWLQTPPEQRKLGGAIFGDRRFDRVFVYHNGAQAYYAARGFRASLRV